MKHLRRLLFNHESGIAMVEFGLALPLLLVMLVGTIEIGRFIIINQKLDKAAYSMADFVTQSASASISSLNKYAQAIPQIMKPFTFDGSVIFTSVVFVQNPTPPCTGTNTICITWQNTQLGSDVSKIGTTGGNATLPGGYIVADGQNVIVAEVYYNYEPLIPLVNDIPILGPIKGLVAQKLYKVAVYKPRQGTLTTLLP